MALALPWKHHDDFTDPQRVRENFERIAQQWENTTQRTVHGRVNADGSLGAGGSGDFTVAKNGTGDYTVTFDSAFADIPTVTGMALAGAGQFRVPYQQANATTSSVRLLIQDSANTLVDNRFDFIAVGAR